MREDLHNRDYLKKSHKEILNYSTKQEEELKTENKRRNFIHGNS